MTSRTVESAVLAAFLGVGLLFAPSAGAAPAPPVPPGPPPGYDGLPYHNMPGRIGHQPGAYTYILGFYLRPRRVLDAAGTGAMSNSDLQASEFGLPGSELGVEPTRRSWTGNASGVRTDVPQNSTSAIDPAGGVKPATTMPGGLLGSGLEDPTGKKPSELPLGGESPEPKEGGGIAPDTDNTPPDPIPNAPK